MRLSVTFEDGSWTFEVSSTGDEPNHYETFELTDLEEAQDTAYDLIEEIARMHDPISDAFGDLFDGQEDY